jgi:hypothetical protein
MGKSESKLVRDEIPSTCPEHKDEAKRVGLNAGLQGVCDEAKAVFDKHYSQTLAEKSFATHPSAMYPRAGIYVKQDAHTPSVLVMTSKGDRASDIALDEAYTYLLRNVGWRHVQKCHDIQKNKSLRWVGLK